MRYYLLLTLVSVASYAVASCAAAAAALLIWRRWRARLHEGAFAAERAGLLATLRFTPAVAGVSALVAFTGVFVRFEPRGTTEEVGWVLSLAAALGGLFAVSAAIRIIGALRASIACSRLVRACGRTWIHAGHQRIWLIDTPHPIAAVVGVLRPRLLISTRILEACSARETDAIVRHEAAHLRRRDNVLRGLMLALPDPLLLTAGGREIQHAWSSAAEQAADEEAAGEDAERRMDLAAALLRVARLEEATPAARMPGVAFYEAFGLEARVRRLLAPAGTPPRKTLAPAFLSLLLLVAAAGVVIDGVARPLHQIIETAVELLP